MRFLVDANLPPDLAGWIGDLGHEAIYVDDVLPAPALDDTVWRHAQVRTLTIISKDSDFIDLSGRNDGPQVARVRCGNLKLSVFKNWFSQRAAEMFWSSKVRGLWDCASSQCIHDTTRRSGVCPRPATWSA